MTMRAQRPASFQQRLVVGGRRAFTLIEILVVLGILTIILGIGLPAVFSAIHKGPMRQAVSDLQEGFLKARMLAILTGHPAELAINVREGNLTVREVKEGNAGGEGAALSQEPTDSAQGEDGESVESPGTPPLPSFSAKLDAGVAVTHVRVNLQEPEDGMEAAVRFYPNGTSDAFSATLVSESGEERNVTLEIITGRPNFTTIR